MHHFFNEIPQVLHAQPEGFDAGFVVAFSAEEAAEHGDLPDDFANRRRALGDPEFDSH